MQPFRQDIPKSIQRQAGPASAVCNISTTRIVAIIANNRWLLTWNSRCSNVSVGTAGESQLELFQINEIKSASLNWLFAVDDSSLSTQGFDMYCLKVIQSNLHNMNSKVAALSVHVIEVFVLKEEIMWILISAGSSELSVKLKPPIRDEETTPHSQAHYCN